MSRNVKSTNGTHLLVTFRGTSVMGQLLATSSDGLTLVIRFNGVLGPYHNYMPLLWDAGGYRDLIEGVSVGILSLVELAPSSCRSSLRLWMHQRVSSADRLLATTADGEMS